MVDEIPDVAGRERAAADPQDRVAQTFFAIGLVARAALADVAPDRASEPLVVALARVADLAATGTEHMRDVILALSDAEVDGQAVAPALRRLVRDFQHRTGIEAALVVTGEQGLLPAHIARELHTVGTQALDCLGRHSQASAVVLGLRLGQRSVTLTIHDDSSGAAIASTLHLELRDVGQRVRRLGGTFVARAGRDGGFLVRARVPLTGALQEWT
jgi:signal transduction histidine kinase